MRLHELELLGFQLVALVGERVQLVRLASQEPVEPVAEHPGQRLALGWSDSDETVIILDPPFDVLDEHSPASAVRSLGVPSRADEVGVDAPGPVLGVSDHHSGAALAAVDAALEVVVVDAVGVGGRLVGVAADWWASRADWA